MSILKGDKKILTQFYRRCSSLILLNRQKEVSVKRLDPINTTHNPMGNTTNSFPCSFPQDICDANRS